MPEKIDSHFFKKVTQLPPRLLKRLINCLDDDYVIVGMLVVGFGGYE